MRFLSDAVTVRIPTFWARAGACELRMMDRMKTAEGEYRCDMNTS
jgi:hypothetical protein